MKAFFVVLACGMLIGIYFQFKPSSSFPNQVEAPVKESLPKVTLLLSGEMQQIFPHLADKQYSGEILKSAFHRMNSESNKICNMLTGRYPTDEVFKSAFSPTLFSGRYSKHLTGLIAGCHNYFKMNDVELHKVITKIASVYPLTEKVCYSVGFSQVYLLAAGIRCQKITAIDIDWRILWAHFQVMESLLIKGRIDFELLHIGWSADFAGQVKELEPRIGVNTFCYALDAPACTSAFKAFPTLGVKQINLQLGHLHQVAISPTTAMVVLYVSNALDPDYTKPDQFEMLLENIRKSISYYQKILIVYHSGGNNQFSMYEAAIYHPEAHLQVTTVCRDNLTWSSAYPTRGQPYQTYLDKISISVEAPECSEK